MGIRTVVVAVLALALVGVLPGGAGAGSATDELRPAIDKVLRILDDPALKGEARTRERRAALRGVMESAIDFPEAARRALAVHWRARTEAEREEFVGLFKDLVTFSYIRLMEPYAGETVQIVGESATNGTTTVLTRIHRRQGEPIPVDYRMHVQATRWLIYDVVVEGVSLVANYRVQFNSIIHTSSYEELVRRIRARVAEQGQTPSAAIRIVPRPG
jgi:phospholipid transport system substrate-binding protein